jgi:predicted dinucleotide-binding enzyme
MNITILGSGKMARAIATRMLAGGNSVTFLSRTPDQIASLVTELAPSAKKGATIKVAELGGPIADPVVINTIWFNAAQQVVKAHSAQLKGKILVDITNPLNQSFDDLATPPGSSAAEEIAKVAPQDTKVVKAFNTTFAGLLTQGHVAGEPLDVFIAGDDAEAKATVAKLIEEGGQHAFDVGPLRFARQLEALGLLNITLQSKLEKPWMSAVKIAG